MIDVARATHGIRLLYLISLWRTQRINRLGLEMVGDEVSRECAMAAESIQGDLLQFSVFGSGVRRATWSLVRLIPNEAAVIQVQKC